MQAAKTADFDVAILDVNLDGEPVSPVADALVARGMPFVFATGYGERGLPEPYRDRPTLKKPFQMDGLKQCCALADRDWSAVASSASASHLTVVAAAHGRVRRRFARIPPLRDAQSNSSASCVMNGSSVMSSRSGVTAMRLSASAEMSVPSAGGWPRMRT